MTWQPLPPAIADWMGMDEDPTSAPIALGSKYGDPDPGVPRSQRPLIDLSPLLDPIEAWLARRRTARPAGRTPAAS